MTGGNGRDDFRLFGDTHYIITDFRSGEDILTFGDMLDFSDFDLDGNGSVGAGDAIASVSATGLELDILGGIVLLGTNSLLPEDFFFV
jgi:hypothetical protein